MSVEDFDSVSCDGCSSYNCSPFLCVSCVNKKVKEEKERILKLIEDNFKKILVNKLGGKEYYKIQISINKWKRLKDSILGKEEKEKEVVKE